MRGGQCFLIWNQVGELLLSPLEIQMISKPVVVVHVCNPSTWAAKTGRLQVSLDLDYIASSVVEPGLCNGGGWSQLHFPTDLP